MFSEKQRTDLTSSVAEEVPMLERRCDDSVSVSSIAVEESVTAASGFMECAVAGGKEEVDFGGLELGSPELPTAGSWLHRAGTCKPCAFVYKEGCKSGVECKFCHLCGVKQQQWAWERKKRQRRVRRIRSGHIAARKE